MRKADTHNCNAETETFLLISTIQVIDVVSAKQGVNSLSLKQFESYTLDTGGARTTHTDYLDRDRIEQCMMKLETMIVKALAGEQLPVVSGAGLRVTVGQWMGVVLLTTVGVGLLSCVFAVLNPHVSTEMYT